jgi:hypothetical protein
MGLTARAKPASISMKRTLFHLLEHRKILDKPGAGVEVGISTAFGCTQQGPGLPKGFAQDAAHA